MSELTIPYTIEIEILSSKPLTDRTLKNLSVKAVEKLNNCCDYFTPIDSNKDVGINAPRTIYIRVNIHDYKDPSDISIFTELIKPVLSKLGKRKRITVRKD
jgi:hypothetical protein